MATYRLEMLTELAHNSVEHTIQANTTEDAIRKAEAESDTVPRLICMTLYREDGSIAKHWGK